MFEEKREIRGIARKELIRYILQLGATEIYNGFYSASQWTCSISEEEYFFMFQSQIPRVSLLFSSEDDQILKDVLTSLSKKTFRAGA
jgi:hypothetical protein